MKEAQEVLKVKYRYDLILHSEELSISLVVTCKWNLLGLLMFVFRLDMKKGFLRNRAIGNGERNEGVRYSSKQGIIPASSKLCVMS